jgi:hypothetical protein
MNRCRHPLRVVQGGAGSLYPRWWGTFRPEVMVHDHNRLPTVRRVDAPGHGMMYAWVLVVPRGGTGYRLIPETKGVLLLSPLLPTSPRLCTTPGLE